MRRYRDLLVPVGGVLLMLWCMGWYDRQPMAKAWRNVGLVVARGDMGLYERQADGRFVNLHLRPIPRMGVR